jgi:drug/metabolite transporter (DMT)-like permease
LVGITLSGILGREVARERQLDTLLLTAIPLAFGGGLLLVLGLLVEGSPRFTGTALIVVIWLAVVNTALAYLLYNHSLQTLTAFEVNIMMNLTPLATAGLAGLLLGERLEEVQIVGMVVVIAGVGLVQWHRRGG